MPITPGPESRDRIQSEGVFFEMLLTHLSLLDKPDTPEVREIRKESHAQMVKLYRRNSSTWHSPRRPADDSDIRAMKAAGKAGKKLAQKVVGGGGVVGAAYVLIELLLNNLQHFR